MCPLKLGGEHDTFLREIIQQLGALIQRASNPLSHEVLLKRSGAVGRASQSFQGFALPWR
jgi:hypothetical protein